MQWLRVPRSLGVSLLLLLLLGGSWQYLLKTKAIEHKDVPMFFKLFHSGDVHSFRKSRVWCLQLLYRSLQVCGDIETAKEWS